ncbi:MAG TPA: uroporphyrinogen-III synthase [Verrucomicrobiae bacterium]|nr:uroporphyrinogen-III synthase [Verrucomicrobiae bacterium]
MVQKAPDLKGKTVALTRPAGQAEEAGKLIIEKGGIPYFIPAIEIKGLTNFSPVKKFISELLKGQVDYVIFMSTNGVKYLFSISEDLKQSSKLKEGLAKTVVIGVGPRTAYALEEEYRVHVSVVPLKYSSEGIIECLQDKEISGKTVRIPRTTAATPTLTEKLKGMGAHVEEIYVYESGLPMDKKLKDKFFVDLTSGKIDAIVFGSGLSVKNIFKMLTENASMETLRSLLKSKVTTVAIGPTTGETLREMDIKVDVMPQDYLFEEALTALARFWDVSNDKLNSFSEKDEAEFHGL